MAEPPPDDMGTSNHMADSSASTSEFRDLLPQPPAAPDLDVAPPVQLSTVQPGDSRLKSLSDPAPLSLGRVDDSEPRLRLHGELGRGGMGAVLRGRDAGLGRDVAVKVLR